MPTVSLHTLGCKLNSAESALLGRQFTERGFTIVDFGQPADVCVVNTCSVTERADRECRQAIRRAVRTSEDPYVIVTGCYAQLEPEAVASIEGVDLVLGTGEKSGLFAHAGAFEKQPHPRVAVSEIETVDTFGPAWTTSAVDRTRACLKVQDGCDYCCSFCTIPLARGGSRSQSVEECVAQATMLAGEGYKEVTLTGVNVGDYGRHSGSSLRELLEKLGNIGGLERLRVSSIEPNLLTDEIIDLVARSTKLCPHFHIPLQSGSDPVLRMMRRRYTTQEYQGLIERIRRAIPDCGIGADVIVGFPGETDRHFEETAGFIAELAISYLHVFTYSERTHTPAAAFGNRVDPTTRWKRSQTLRLMGEKKKQAFALSMVGRTMPVLCEEDCEDGLRRGFTPNYVRVGVPDGSAGRNDILPVRITGVMGDLCIGEPSGRQVAA